VENINDLYGTTKRISEVDFSKYKIKPQPGDVFMTRIGDVGTPAVVTTNEPIAYYVSLALIRPNKELLPQYLYFYIKSSAFRKELYKRTLHTAVPIKINKEDIGKCRVAVPPIKEQQRVIALLSRFDTLCNDISSGLPAEIEARQKQYEYYRDKLLSFKEVTS
jgi:type I restriction enzyme S subunit